MTTEINNFRPVSYSEGNIYDIKKPKTLEIICTSPVKHLNLIEPFLDMTKSESYSSFNIDTNDTNDTNINDTNDIKNKYSKIKQFMMYIYKRLLMFMIHLALISVFEIVFFFRIVSEYENLSIKNLVGSYFSKIPFECSLLNYSQKENFTKIFNNIVNIDDINNNSIEAYNKRKAFNRELLVKAWMYFVGIMIFNIILVIIKFIFKLSVNLKKIFMDNILMIMILGIYEYLFFKSIILEYQIISGNEMSQYIVSKFSGCLN